LASSVLIHLLGGVALLLWGLRMVRTGALRAYGAELRRVIGRALRNRMQAFATGLGVTAVLQSSTATALMTASFAERGLVQTMPGLAVMLGADVGTALVAQVLAIDVRWLSPLLVLAGMVAFTTGGSTRRRDLGRAAVGLGLMLLALHLIVEASAPVRDSALVRTLFAALDDEPAIAILIAAGLTWLAHSSLAIVLLVTSLAGIGLVPLPLALALVLGANVGGAMPAIVATWRGQAEARRLTIGNAVFRIAGAVAAALALAWIVPVAELFGSTAGERVVRFHLLFNVALAIVFLPLLPLAARLARRLLPADTATSDDPGLPRYLDPGVLDTPPIAIAAAQRETLRMGDAIESMLRDTLAVLRTDDRKLAQEISRRDDVIDRLHEAIKLYLTQVSRDTLGPADGRRVLETIVFTTNLEHIGDIIDKNLIELAQKKIKNRLSFSEEGMAEIVALHGEVLDALKLSLAAFIGGEVSVARQLLVEKTRFRERERKAAERHFERLRSGRVESIETSSLHLDILRDLKRIHSHLIAVAYPILEEAGELRESRLASA